MANRVFDTLRAMDRARRRRARQGDRARPAPGRIGAKQRAAGAAAVRAGAGDAGRPEGADHPRLLHAAAAAVSVRGQCRGALRGAGGDRAERRCWSSISLDVLLEAAGKPDSAARPRARDSVIPAAADLTFQRRAGRGDPRARRASRAGSTRAGGIDAGDRRSCRQALGIEPDDTLEAVEARDRRRPASAVARMGIRRRRSARPARRTTRTRARACRSARSASGADAHRHLSLDIFCTEQTRKPRRHGSSPAAFAKNASRSVPAASIDEQDRVCALCAQAARRR